VATRFGYFFTFCLAEGANILNGFGYNGVISENEKTGEQVYGWNRLASVEILRVEFAESPRDISTYWNMTVGHWLKHYVYERSAPASKKPPSWAVYTTNLLSGLWHGFYPGYFIHFTTAAMMVEAARRTREKLRPRFAGDERPSLKKKFYDVIGMLLIKMMMGYSMATFVGLSWQNCVAYNSSMVYSGHIGLVTWIIVMIIIPMPRRRGPGGTTGQVPHVPTAGENTQVKAD